jgi:hypothetical protein
MLSDLHIARAHRDILGFDDRTELGQLIAHNPLRKARKLQPNSTPS